MQPLVTLNFTIHCKPLVDKLKEVVSQHHMYKFEEASEDAIAFKMVNENATEVSLASSTHHSDTLRPVVLCVHR